MKQVDIVVANYNCESSLERLLLSLCNQTYHNIKIIIVDDCSTDHSVFVIKSFAKKHSNITLIEKKENTGASDSRNIGLDHCQGYYIYFADADDYLSPECISTLVDLAQKYDGDIVDEESIVVYGDKKFTERPIPKEVKILDAEEIYTYPRYSRGKLYKASVIGNERFDTTLPIYEDFYFEQKIKKNINTYLYSNTAHYFYVQNSTSLSSANHFKHLCFISCAQKCSELYTHFEDKRIVKNIENLIFGNALAIVFTHLSKVKNCGRISRTFLKDIKVMLTYRKLNFSYRLLYRLLSIPLISSFLYFIIKRINFTKLYFNKLAKKNPYNQ